MKRLFLAFLSVVIAFFGVFVSPMVAFCEDVALPFSDVETDLSFIDRVTYPKNDNGQVEVVHFVEYCFSYKNKYKDSYSLYVYVYNPKAKPVVTGPNYNSISMSCLLDDEGNAVDYNNYHLIFHSKSDDNLFYKFRVDLSDDYFSFIKSYALSHNNSRRYCVAGVQLTYVDRDLAQDNTVSFVYDFSGFAEGCGSDSYSTLSCKYNKLETVELELGHTFWRSKTSSLGRYHQNQLDTVYFSVPERFYNEYGSLQRIKAEW